MDKLIYINECWCGCKELEVYSPNYLICKKCKTIISNPQPDYSTLTVADDEADFYGKNYWLQHVNEDYGYPNIFQRSRLDLSERCIYWLKTILKYKLPPANTLELGCSHGGLVFLMKLAGYNSVGAEMSPWVCDFARQIFDIPMLCGPLEDIGIQDSSIDLIMLLDVFEHLSDPLHNLKNIQTKLSNEGILILQTPCYNGKKYSELVDQKDLFLSQLKENEHLYLFNKTSIKQVLHKSGFGYVSFEPSIFSYDMFVFASKNPLKTNDDKQIVETLKGTSNGRIILSMIDMYNDNNKTRDNLRECEMDRGARLEVIKNLSLRLQESDKDRSARLEVIEDISNRLRESDKDRADRLTVIEDLSRRIQKFQKEKDFEEEILKQQRHEINGLMKELLGLKETLLMADSQNIKLQEKIQNIANEVTALHKSIRESTRLGVIWPGGVSKIRKALDRMYELFSKKS